MKKKYETFYACPGCGSLVPKGTKQCECGYDFSGPASRIVRSLRRLVPFFLCVILILVGSTLGYYAGRKSMNSQLTEQFESGQDTGYEIGYQEGLHKGIDEGANIGLENVESSFSSIYANGYRAAMHDAGVPVTTLSPYPYLSREFEGKEQLHKSLAEEYSLIPKS